MRVLAHLSDIHFGRVDESLIEPLVSSIAELKPDIVAISGDLTQRARSHQFVAAREFLDRLPRPQIVVPGNHDVPLYNPLRRFVNPLRKYRRYITADLEPFFADEEIAVAGINTARSLTVKGGRVNRVQIDAVGKKLCPLPDEVTKVVVTHHPFDLPEGHSDTDLVGRSQEGMEAFASCGADVFLSGHLHISHTGHTAKRYKIKGHSALVVSAGTASSTRGRGEANSFNVIRVAHPEIEVLRYEWKVEQQTFVPVASEKFRHSPDGWQREST